MTTLPERTSVPGRCDSTGIDSPVIAASSSCNDSPHTTVPSAARTSPAATTRTSPGTTSRAGTVRTTPLRRTRALAAPSRSRASTARSAQISCTTPTEVSPTMTSSTTAASVWSPIAIVTTATTGRGRGPEDRPAARPPVSRPSVGGGAAARRVPPGREERLPPTSSSPSPGRTVLVMTPDAVGDEAPRTRAGGHGRGRRGRRSRPEDPGGADLGLCAGGARPGQRP